MSHDVLGLAPVVLAGHVVLVVWLINVSHAFGYNERTMARVKLALLAALLGLPLALRADFALGAGSWPGRAYAFCCLAAALVGLPVATLARLARRSPAGIGERTRVLDLVAGRDAESFIGAGRHHALLRLPGNESFRLRLREWDVRLPALPHRLDGLSLIHLSDLHFAPCFQRGYFEAVINAVAGWEADLVLFTGDLVDHDSTLSWIVPLLSRLRGRLGTYSILGNHDMTHQPKLIRRELAEAGFTDLEGRWERLRVRGATLAIGGSSAPWGRRPDPADQPAADFRLLLSHSPDQFARARRQGVDLMLSGHNHGGQIRLPIIGPVFMPSAYSRRFDRGFFRSGPTLLHVSEGIAGLHPIRYGCPPEASRLVLRATPHVDPPHPPNHARSGDRRLRRSVTRLDG